MTPDEIRVRTHFDKIDKDETTKKKVRRNFTATKYTYFFFERPGARFSKRPVITEPVKLFCFPFQMGVSKLLKVIQ